MRRDSLRKNRFAILAYQAAAKSFPETLDSQAHRWSGQVQSLEAVQKGRSIFRHEALEQIVKILGTSKMVSEYLDFQKNEQGI